MRGNGGKGWKWGKEMSTIIRLNRAQLGYCGVARPLSRSWFGHILLLEKSSCVLLYNSTVGLDSNDIIINQILICIVILNFLYRFF